MAFCVHAAEKLVHECGAIGSETPSRPRQHPLRNGTQFNQIFPICGILRAVSGSPERGFRRIVEFCPDPAGKMKRASDADCSDGVELVRVIDDLLGKCLRRIIPAVTVARHGMADRCDQGFILTAETPEQSGGFVSSLLCMADSSAGIQLFRTCDVVQERRKTDRQILEVRMRFPGKDFLGVVQDAQRVRKVMTAGRIAEDPLRFRADCRIKLFFFRRCHKIMK